ncbi:hypothetical protein LINPERPRIM_LOCUS24956 [Linum perenne]
MGADEDIRQWIFEVLRRASDTQQQQFSGVLWSLWNERNEQVWQHRSKSEDLVVRMAIDAVAEWVALQHIRGSGVANNTKGCGEWHPLAEPLVKVNIDATIFQQDRLHGVGAALRSHDGTQPARECEENSMLMAIQWVKDLQIQGVILESDYQELVSAIKREDEDESEFGSIVGRCKVELRSLLETMVNFVRRRGNQVAHELAKRSVYSVHSVEGDTPLASFILF